jgi:signal transduction histidine kinase
MVAVAFRRPWPRLSALSALWSRSYCGVVTRDDRSSGPHALGLVPASLLPDDGDVAAGRRWRRVRRSARDWTVDVTSFVLALTVGGLFLLSQIQVAGTRPSDALIATDVVLGAVACLSLWWRRRWPVAIAVVLILISGWSASSLVAASIGLFAVAVHRRVGTVLPVAVLYLSAGAVYFWLRPIPDQPFWISMVMAVAVTAALVAWGMFARARRQLVWSLHERAERAEAEQRLLAEHARRAERARIAREMHDVVAHRVSLMVLHAGALEVRPDLPPSEVRHTAELIRVTARQALEELRAVVGVLRDEAESQPAPQAPQPTLTEISRLVDDSRRAGTNVELQVRVERPESAPGPLSRDAYRIVQEALTNVNKHATGTTTTVALTGGPGEGLRVTVRNRLPLGPPSTATLPGAGMGLVGLAERVSLSGGTLSHGRTHTGEFVVTAELRWAR